MNLEVSGFAPNDLGFQVVVSDVEDHTPTDFPFEHGSAWETLFATPKS